MNLVPNRGVRHRSGAGQLKLIHEMLYPITLDCSRLVPSSTLKIYLEPSLDPFAALVSVFTLFVAGF
jgi:hypothetical protein